jgi:hypothetical protein
MGRVHFVPQEDGQVLPLLWRSPFSRAIQERLVSFDNPAGDINNIELELAASVAQHNILAKKIDIRESTIHNSSGNVSTVWWQRKGSTSSSDPTTRLLRLIHQHHCQYVPLFDYIAGEANAVTYTCSRLWHLSDAQLLAYFELTFPQNRPWQTCQLQKPMHSALILALSTSASREELACLDIARDACVFCLETGEHRVEEQGDDPHGLEPSKQAL